MLKPILMCTALTSLLALAGCHTMPLQQTAPGHNATDMSQLKMLTDVTWQQIVPVDAKPNNSANPYSQPNIHFSTQDRRFSGSDGCNKIMGTYEANGQQLKLSAIASTRMACPSQNSTISRQFLDGLSKTTAYRFDGSDLVLLDTNNNSVLMLSKVASK